LLLLPENTSTLPNKKVHLLAGIITGAVVSGARTFYFEQQDTPPPGSAIEWLSIGSIVLIGAAVGGQFGLLPDMLEPAKKDKWRHRKFFHSYTLLALIVWFTYQTETNFELHDLTRHFFTVAAAGYLSHLLLDSRTPSGLPWI
jgi:membrane-bound metal-dependent hydrolase YbcI (DUF457 family)